jgi:hypothetical protein
MTDAGLDFRATKDLDVSLGIPWLRTTFWRIAFDRCACHIDTTLMRQSADAAVLQTTPDAYTYPVPSMSAGLKADWNQGG